MNHSTIYTKTGDRGETGVQGGVRLSKTSIRIEALGGCDELNSTIGLVIAWLPLQASVSRQRLEIVQRQLFAIGATIAGHTAWPTTEQNVKSLEDWIDEIDGRLKPLAGFILPGGSQAGALCHLARAIGRRCERLVIKLNNEFPIDSLIIKYLNRLSDFLFVLARLINQQTEVDEQLWHQ